MCCIYNAMSGHKNRPCDQEVEGAVSIVFGLELCTAVHTELSVRPLDSTAGRTDQLIVGGNNGCGRGFFHLGLYGGNRCDRCNRCGRRLSNRSLLFRCRRGVARGTDVTILCT